MNSLDDDPLFYNDDEGGNGSARAPLSRPVNSKPPNARVPRERARPEPVKIGRTTNIKPPAVQVGTPNQAAEKAALQQAAADVASRLQPSKPVERPDLSPRPAPTDDLDAGGGSPRNLARHLSHEFDWYGASGKKLHDISRHLDELPGHDFWEIGRHLATHLANGAPHAEHFRDAFHDALLRQPPGGSLPVDDSNRSHAFVLNDSQLSPEQRDHVHALLHGLPRIEGVENGYYLPTSMGHQLPTLVGQDYPFRMVPLKVHTRIRAGMTSDAPGARPDGEPSIRPLLNRLTGIDENGPAPRGAQVADRLSPRHAKILEHLAGQGGGTAREVAEATGIPEAEAEAALQHAAGRGHAEPADANGQQRYSVTEDGTAAYNRHWWNRMRGKAEQAAPAWQSVASSPDARPSPAGGTPGDNRLPGYAFDQKTGRFVEEPRNRPAPPTLTGEPLDPAGHVKDRLASYAEADALLSHFGQHHDHLATMGDVAEQMGKSQGQSLGHVEIRRGRRLVPRTRAEDGRSLPPVRV